LEVFDVAVEGFAGLLEGEQGAGCEALRVVDFVGFLEDFYGEVHVFAVWLLHAFVLFVVFGDLGDVGVHEERTILALLLKEYLLLFLKINRFDLLQAHLIILLPFLHSRFLALLRPLLHYGLHGYAPHRTIFLSFGRQRMQLAGLPRVEHRLFGGEVAEEADFFGAGAAGVLAAAESAFFHLIIYEGG
jgi:hypothetical protein